MKDIDRNINSYLYCAASAFNKYNNLVDFNSSNFEKIYSIDGSIVSFEAADIGYVDIDAGEYYYRHSLYTSQSTGCCLFKIYTAFDQFPLFSYYTFTPVELTYKSVIPYRFIVNSPTRVSFWHEQPTSQDFTLNYTIELFKRVI